MLGSRYVAGRRRPRLGLAAPGCQPRRRHLRAPDPGVGVRDLTGGFKCIRREVLEGIDLPSVRAEGYVFQIEVTYRALLAGFTVVEVPIMFADRTAGQEQDVPRIALEAMLDGPDAQAHGPRRRWPGPRPGRNRRSVA